MGKQIKNKLKRELQGAESVIDVQLYSRVITEYSMQLSNSRHLVVNLTIRTCSCRWWQINRFPCRYAMAVMSRGKKWVCDYVSVCYKGPM